MCFIRVVVKKDLILKNDSFTNCAVAHEFFLAFMTLFDRMTSGDLKYCAQVVWTTFMKV